MDQIKEFYIKFSNFVCSLFLNYPQAKSVWSFSYKLTDENEIRSHPAVRVHGERLFRTINAAIGLLEDGDSLSITLINLGYTHAKYGVKEEHFPFVGQALIETLQAGLGDTFGADARRAWLKLFSVVHDKMRVGLMRAENEKYEAKELDEQLLSADDKIRVKDTWTEVMRTGGLREYGTRMMIQIFTSHVEYKNLWKFAKYLDTEEKMRADPYLQKHGERLFNSLDLVVANVDDLRQVKHILIQLGYKHFLYGARIEHLPVSSQSIYIYKIRRLYVHITNLKYPYISFLLR